MLICFSLVGSYWLGTCGVVVFSAAGRRWSVVALRAAGSKDLVRVRHPRIPDHRSLPVGTMFAEADPRPVTRLIPSTARKIVGSDAEVVTVTMPFAADTEPMTPGWPAR